MSLFDRVTLLERDKSIPRRELKLLDSAGHYKMLRFLPLLALQSAFYTYTQSNQVTDQAHAEFEQSFVSALFFVRLKSQFYMTLRTQDFRT